MKPAIVVGTRPEIIKMAPVVRACQARGTPWLLLHTGQHYSFEMDGVFFQELGLPPAHVNLEVGSGSQNYQIAAVIQGITPVLEEHQPDVVLVEGDTNSVVAAGLAANKLRIPVGHVEAGLRSYDRSMPEEINRILVDHLGDWLFAPTDHSRDLLLAEGLPAGRIHVTGNTVVDELLLQRERAKTRGSLATFEVQERGYAVATVHRLENVENESRLRGIFEGLAAVAKELKLTVLAALHPRTRGKLEALGIAPAGVRLMPPLGYLDFLALHDHAALTLTDSGGLQEEACCLGVPCVTLRDNTERPEAVAVGANLLAGADPAKILEAARTMAGRARAWKNPYGDGRSGLRIVDLLLGRTPEPLP